MEGGWLSQYLNGPTGLSWSVLSCVLNRPILFEYFEGFFTFELPVELRYSQMV